MSRFKLDYDEGTWLLTDNHHDAWITTLLTDQEGYELLDALKPLVERRAEYEDQKQIYRGATLAGFLERPEFSRGIED